MVSIIFVIWLVLFIALFSLFGLKETVLVLKHSNPFMLLAAFITVIIATFVTVGSWKTVLNGMNYKIKFKKLFEVMMAGFFIDNLLPNIAPAGELSMAYFLSKKEKVPLHDSFTSIIIQTTAWFVGFTSLASCLVVLLFFEKVIPFQIAVLMGFLITCFILILLLILYLVFKPKKAEELLLWIVRSVFKLGLKFTRFKHFEEEAIEFIEENVRSFNYAFRKQRKKKLLAKASLLMALHHFLIIFSFYLVVVSFGVKTGFLQASAVFLLVYMISLLSMIPGQFGIYEATAIPLIGMNSSMLNGALVTSAARLLHYWFIVFLGGYYALKINVGE